MYFKNLKSMRILFKNNNMKYRKNHITEKLERKVTRTNPGRTNRRLANPRPEQTLDQDQPFTGQIYK